jgi:hypothetical protein
VSDVKRLYILRHAGSGIIVGVGWDVKELMRTIQSTTYEVEQLNNYVISHFLVERPDGWEDMKKDD